MIPLGWKALVVAATILAAISILVSAALFTGLRDVSLDGCHRQNRLRHELNVTLAHFHEPPRFKQVDCKQAYSLHPF